MLLPSLREDQVTTVFLIIAVGMAALHVLTRCKNPVTIVLFVCIVIAAVAYLWQRQRAADAGHMAPDAVLSSIAADVDAKIGDAPKANLDLDLYTLRNVAPGKSRPLVHLPLRPEVMRVVASLKRYVRQDRGKMWRLIACLEDFFARFDAAMMGGSASRAAGTVQVLRDTRSDALNIMHSLTFARPEALYPRVEKAIDVVQRVTQRCLSMLSAKYAGSAAMRAQEWRPPYSFDARQDARYHVFL